MGLDTQEPIASNSIILPTSNIDEIYEKCLAWCRKNNVEIIESDKPSLIIAHGVFLTFQGSRNYPDRWEISFQLSTDIRGVKIDLTLLNVIFSPFTLIKKQPRHMISPYPGVVRSLYTYLGVYMSDDVLRDLYPREYLERYIDKFSMSLGVCIFSTVVLILVGWYREYVSLIRGEVLKFFILSMAPILVGLTYLDEWFVLKSIRNRLYLKL
jgi:hypothetical protein